MVWVKNKAERTKTGRHKLEEGRRKVRKFRSGGKTTLDTSSAYNSVNL